MRRLLSVLCLVWCFQAHADWFRNAEKITDSCYKKVADAAYKVTVRPIQADPSVRVTYIGSDAMSDPTSTPNPKLEEKGEQKFLSISNRLSALQAAALPLEKRVALAQCITSRLIKYKNPKEVRSACEALGSGFGMCMDFSSIFTRIARSRPLFIRADKASGFIVKGHVNHSFSAVVMNSKMYTLEPQIESGVLTEVHNVYLSIIENGERKPAITSKDIELIPPIKH